MLIAATYGHIAGQGAVGIRKEFDIIREYGPLVVKYLREQGHTVDIISKDTGSSYLADRCKEENKKDYDMCLDFHINAGGGHGCEVLFYPTSSKGKELATKISKEIATLGFANRGAKADVRKLYMLRHTNSPCVIIEPFFCDSKTDMALYNPDKIAKAIVKGITGQEVKELVKETIVKIEPLNLNLQKFLNANNFTDYENKKLAEDGITGKRTKAALDKLYKKFQ